MSKKVGIVTIIDYNNIGNRLQNYAVQEVLKGLNTKPETIRDWSTFKVRAKDLLKKYIFKNKSTREKMFSLKWIKFSKYGYNDTISIGGGV